MNLFHLMLISLPPKTLINERKLIRRGLELLKVGCRLKFKVCGLFPMLLLLASAVVAQKSVKPRLMLPFAGSLSIDTIIFSPNNKLYLTLTTTGFGQIWDFESGTLLLNVPGKIANLSADRGFFWTTSGNRVEQWDFEKVRIIDSLVIPDNSIDYIRICSSINRILTASERSIKLWDLEKKNLIDSSILEHDYEWTVNFIEFSPDGSRLVVDFDCVVELIDGSVPTGFFDPRRMIKIINTDNGAVIRRIEGEVDWFQIGLSVGFCAGGNNLLIPRDSNFELLDLKSGNLIHSIHEIIENEKFRSAHLSPKGNFVWINSSKSPSKIWDVKRGIANRISDEINDKEYFSTFSPDGNFVLTKNEKNQLKLWEINTGLLKLTIENSANHSLKEKFSPDGSLFITYGGYKNTVVDVWNVETGELQFSLHGHKESVESTLFSPNGQLLVTFSSDSTAVLWDLITGKIHYRMPLKADRFISASYSSDSRYLYTSTVNDCNLWDVKNTSLIHSSQGHVNSLRHVVFKNDGGQLVTASSDNTVKIWDILNLDCVHSLKGQIKMVQSMTFSPDGKYLLLIPLEGRLELWDVSTGKQLFYLEHDAEGFDHAAAFSLDGRYFACVVNTVVVIIWDILNMKCQSQIDSGDLIEELKFSPDGSFLITTHGYKLQIWEVDTGNFRSSIAGSKVAFSPDGAKLVTSYVDSIHIWSTEDLRLINSIKLTSKFADDISLCKNGCRIAVTCGKNIELWDYQKVTLLQKFEGHSNEITSASFTLDGLSLVTSSTDNTVKIWEIESGHLLRNISFRGSFRDLNFHSNRFVTIENSILHLYDFESGDHLFSFVSLNDRDFLLLHPDGYYDGIEAARNLVYFVCNDEIIELAQIKDALYVPGLLEKIMSGEEINYPKLSKLDICDALPVVTKLEDEGYAYSIKPRRLPLERAEVYVNGKLILNYPADQLRFNGSSYELVLEEKDLDVHLHVGKENKVKIIGVVKSEKGSELRTRGLVIPATKESRGDVVPPRLFAVMIGVNDYRDPSLKLNYPAKDAMELGKAVETAAMKLLGKENVFMYPIYTGVKPETGFTTPEKAGIKRALEDIGKKARPEDIVLMFFAGHGEMQGADGKVFTFLTADASKFNPIGISTKELQDWLSYEGPHKMLANKTILIFDACNSGQATVDLMASARNDDNSDRIRQVEDLKDKAGTFILAGSAPNQAAYELPQYQQGMLTYSLLSVLKNNPTILDKQTYLNVQKWFLETEKKLKEEVESKGLKQEARPFGTASIQIGIVDEEVRSNINLVNERAMVYCDNILERESADDILKLKELISKEFSALSARGSESPIYYTIAATEQTNRLNISYIIQEDKIVAKIKLRKGGDSLLDSVITGLKSDLDGLVKEITEEVVKAAK